jgi:hypothetical protein
MVKAVRAKPLESINAIRWHPILISSYVIRFSRSRARSGCKDRRSRARAGCDLLPLGSKINTQWRIDF